MAKFVPVTNADDVYDSGNWRKILSDSLSKDWNTLMLGANSHKHELCGIILPSMDYLNMDTEDQKFRSSVAACWTTYPDKRLPKHFTPTSWALPIVCYPYMPRGDDKEHWISPQNRANMIGNENLSSEQTADAFDDLKYWIKRNKTFTDQDKKFFLETEKFSDDPLVPGRTVRFFAMALCRDKEDNNLKPTLVGFTATAYNYLIEQMRWVNEVGAAEPIDPDWPRYLIGDPTNPKGALVWRADQIQVDPKDTRNTNVMAFTRQREILDNPMERVPVSQEVLDKRFVMVDPDNWNIPTYEEQVQHMVDWYAPEVTTEMIRSACGHRCDVPERTTNQTISTGTPTSTPPSGAGAAPSTHPPAPAEAAREQDPMAAVTGGQTQQEAPAQTYAPTSGVASAVVEPAPVVDTPAPQPAEATPDPTPVVDETLYWAGVTGTTPTKMTTTQLQAEYDAGNSQLQVNLPDGSWKPLADCGLVRAAEPATPTVPDAETPPSVPTGQPEVPSVPDQASVTAASQTDEALRAEVRQKLFPDEAAFSALSDDTKKEAEAIITSVMELRKQGKEELPEELISRVVAIVSP